MPEVSVGPERDAVSIVGVGYSPITRNSGVTPLTLAVQAILAAVADAGISVDDVDGLGTHHLNDTAPIHDVAAALGLTQLTWYNEEYGGGNRAPLVVGQAARACETGAAKYAVVYRALNGRTGVRMGGTTRPMPGRELQFQVPFGMLTPGQNYGLAAKQHMLRYGTPAEAFGVIAVQQRANAVRNERAVMRTPITLGDYFASRMIAEPFRLLDHCLETDGACAIVLATTPRARDLPQPTVTIKAVAATLGPGDLYKSAELTSSPARLLAQPLLRAADVSVRDIDVVEFYDAFTFAVLVQLEDYGFCKPGEGGDYVLSGATALGGEIPVNTHGGFLSEGYIHGLNHICEAVSQLRGTAGERQVPGARIALSTAQPGYYTGATSAVILGAGR